MHLGFIRFCDPHLWSCLFCKQLSQAKCCSSSSSLACHCKVLQRRRRGSVQQEQLLSASFSFCFPVSLFGVGCPIGGDPRHLHQILLSPPSFIDLERILPFFSPEEPHAKNILALLENMAERPVGFGKVVLFRQGAPEGLTYRIPALLYLPFESAFLAFAEERSSPRDEDARFLVMRRGQKEGASVQWGPQESLTIATLPGHRTMNPCPLYERNSRTIFLFFICVQTEVTEYQQISKGKNAARLCYVSSQDGGRTWSQTTDLTEKAITGNLRKWATFAVGPGHGIQLSSGRLVVPAYTYYIHKRCFGYPLNCWTKPHSFIFYSDDGGRNWTQGRLLKAFRTSECQVAELTSQDNSPVLYCNSRSPDKYRAEAFSTDDGELFDESFLSKELCEPPNGCQGSVVSFSPTVEPGVRSSSASYKKKKPWLMFSHPTSSHRRVDLGIYLNMSPLEKGSWKAPWVLNEGPSGYSDLAVCMEGKSLLFGCLFECGAAHSYEEIAFQLFTEAELLRGGRV